MSTLLNFLMFQLGWFASVLLGASDWPWLAPVVVLPVLLVHLAMSDDRAAERKLMAYALAVGLVWENVVSAAGLLVYPSGQPLERLAPAWILAMWPLLAITLNVSLRWLKGRYLLAALFGAIGGPLAFFAGERLDAVVFPQPAPAIVVLAVGWAAMFPLLMWLSQRYDGFAGNAKPSLEAG